MHPGPGPTAKAYARQSFRANVGADARRAAGLLADAEDQIAFGESLLRRREAGDRAGRGDERWRSLPRPIVFPRRPSPRRQSPRRPCIYSAPREDALDRSPAEADDLAGDDAPGSDALDRRLILCYVKTPP